MSILVHEELEQRLSSKNDLRNRLIVTPLLDPKGQIGPACIDLRLGTEFIETGSRRGAATDPVGKTTVSNFEDVPQRYQVALGQDVVLHPRQFILASSLEFVRIPSDLGAQILSRSSWGRVGLTVSTASAVQPGYTGMITFQLVNSGSMPIVLHPGLRVVQMILWSSPKTTSHAYGPTSGGKYVGDLGPVESKVETESEELAVLKSVGHRLGAHRSSVQDAAAGSR